MKCMSVYHNVDISTRGNFSPCCKFDKAKMPRMNVDEVTVDDYLNSKFLAGIQNSMANGEWPRGCDRCAIDEASGIPSKRQLDLQRYGHLYTGKTEILTAALSFGNTCNLKCIMCSSVLSSQWRKEYNDIYNIDWPKAEIVDQDFVRQVYEAMPNLIHLDVPGGEPFLNSPELQMALMDMYIDSGQAANMTIHYTTNAQLFPDERWWDKWQHFKEIDIQLSIDGVGDTYEYIRYPANWTVLVTNIQAFQDKIKACPNIRLSISTAVSAYNIFYLPDLLEWIKHSHLPLPYLGRVHDPDWLRPEVFPMEIRVTIAKKLYEAESELLLPWIKLLTEAPEDLALFEKWKDLTKTHDQYRKISFAEKNPSFAMIMEWA